MPDTLSPNVTDVIELTRTLVRCESVTPREAGALQLLEQTLAPLGFTCERMDFTEAGTDDVANLYARIGNGGKHLPARCGSRLARWRPRCRGLFTSA